MRIWGLHIIDIFILLSYLFGMLIIGKIWTKKVKNTSDYFLADRKTGRLLQFFLGFGSKTDASGAVMVSSEVYRQGVGGVWWAFQMVFVTPFFWFFYVWGRRVRLTTNADLYVDRLQSRFLAATYAVILLFIVFVTCGFGFLVSYKTMSALLPKPPAQYTTVESQQVKDFHEYQDLKRLYDTGKLPQLKCARFEVLQNMEKRGQLRSYVSYLRPLPFYIVYGGVIFAIIMGGLGAAAVSDAIQSILVMVFSFIILPFGLVKLGGFSGLHQKVADNMFNMFNHFDTSEYTWYSVAAIVFLSLLSFGGGSVTVAGAAKDENAARIGSVSGAFAKRFVTIGWVLCGLVAVGLYGGQIADPDAVWGTLTVKLLCPGAIGLMLAGILAAQISAADVLVITQSALFVKNIYTPLLPNRSEKHYVFAGRVFIIVLLVSGIFMALFFNKFGIISILKDVLSAMTFLGTSAYLVYLWRRLTVPAVFSSWLICLIIIGIAPRLLPEFKSIRCSESFLLKTEEITIESRTVEGSNDNEISHKKVIPSNVIFFDAVARCKPNDPNSKLEGIGRFNIEQYILYHLGVPVKSFSKAGLLTSRMIFDAVFPLSLMIFISYCTKPPHKTIVDRFYAKMKTPVSSNPEEDAREIEKSFVNPTRFDHLKLFPKSNWEFCKWTKSDTIGFLLCWGGVAFVLVLLWAILNVGK
ncbi:MAG: hypothetical protein A2Y10_20010 [Planctomycetes bacterium GWF2_41_51]|nr:MAG: hypothetical protein A2Y10_20010 [Planctomycetes bacterium GWF2_41_51]